MFVWGYSPHGLPCTQALTLRSKMARLRSMQRPESSTPSMPKQGVHAAASSIK